LNLRKKVEIFKLYLIIYIDDLNKLLILGDSKNNFDMYVRFLIVEFRSSEKITSHFRGRNHTILVISRRKKCEIISRLFLSLFFQIALLDFITKKCIYYVKQKIVNFLFSYSWFLVSGYYNVLYFLNFPKRRFGLSG